MFNEEHDHFILAIPGSLVYWCLIKIVQNIMMADFIPCYTNRY